MASCTEAERALLNGLLTDQDVGMMLAEWRITQVPATLRAQCVQVERDAIELRNRLSAVYSEIEKYGLRQYTSRYKVVEDWFASILHEAQLPKSSELRAPHNTNTSDNSELAFFKRSQHD